MRSPLGAPRRAQRKSTAARWTFAVQSLKVCPAADFRRTKSKSPSAQWACRLYRSGVAKCGSGRRLSQNKVQKSFCPVGRWTLPKRSGKVCPAADFRREKSFCPVDRWTLPKRSGEVCPAADFRSAKSESVPGPGFFPGRVFRRVFARLFCRGRAGKKASYKREAAYRKRRKKDATSYLDFRRRRSDLCAAGPENGLGPGRAGKAAAG